MSVLKSTRVPAENGVSLSDRGVAKKAALEDDLSRDRLLPKNGDLRSRLGLLVLDRSTWLSTTLYGLLSGNLRLVVVVSRSASSESSAVAFASSLRTPIIALRPGLRGGATKADWPPAPDRGGVLARDADGDTAPSASPKILPSDAAA